LKMKLPPWCIQEKTALPLGCHRDWHRSRCESLGGFFHPTVARI
jgi:hypothetical protein